MAEDNLHINTHNYIELKYWSAVLKSNPEEIKKAVSKTGHKVSAVKDYIHLSRLNESDFSQF